MMRAWLHRVLLSYVLAVLAGMALLAAMGAPARELLAAAFLSLAVAALLSAWLARRFARQAAKIEEFAGRLAAGDLSARVAANHCDEFSAPAAALDAAAEALQRKFAALEDNGRQLAALLDSMQEAVIAVNARGEVTWLNAAMRRIVAAPPRQGRALAHSIRDPEVLSPVTAALSRREVCRARATSVAPGRIFEVTAAPIPDGGVVAVLHDVSEVERAAATRRDFVANVSHELRTPLTCVTGYVETLLDDPALSSQAREFLRIILKNASRMTRLTEDLLALASVESGDYKPRLQPMPAAELIEDTVASLAGLAADASMTIGAENEVQGFVLADPDALHQVFGNLVENAVKYGKSGGRILIGARSLGPSIEFYVRDFGSGIAYEHLGRIFERFYRVDKARSRESGGTGLGLAIAKHIVLAHGGDIRCESELGAGATFLFRLPVFAGVSAAESRAAAVRS